MDAPFQSGADVPIRSLLTPHANNKISSDFQLYLPDQRATRMAIASVIVEDGVSAYALTSRRLIAAAMNEALVLAQRYLF